MATFYGDKIEKVTTELSTFACNETGKEGTAAGFCGLIASLKSAISDCSGGDFDTIKNDLDAISGYWEELRTQVEKKVTEINDRAIAADDYYNTQKATEGDSATSTIKGVQLYEAISRPTYIDGYKVSGGNYFVVFNVNTVTIDDSNGNVKFTYKKHIKYDLLVIKNPATADAPAKTINLKGEYHEVLAFKYNTVVHLSEIVG